MAILGPVMAFSVFSHVSADVIVMKNGDKITGSIKKVWDEEIFIEPAYADEFGVDQSEVAYIESAEEFEVKLNSGNTVLASFAGADEDGLQIVAIDGETRSVPLSQLSELEEQDKFSDWEVRADVNTTINKGNTDSENYLATLYAMYKYNRQRHIFDFRWSREYQNSEQIKANDFVRYNLNYEVKEPWFFGASASYEQDPFKNLDYRYNAIPALGYNFWDDAKRRFNIQAGVGYQNEKTTSTQSSGAVAAMIIRFLYKFKRPDLQLYLDNTTTKAFYSRKNAVTQFSTGLRYEITDLLYTNLELNLDYESEPVDGAENEDIGILFGFGLEFDK